LNYAVYSQRTKIKLYLPDEELGYTMHHSIMFSYLSKKYKDIEDKFVEVIANTLDSLLEANGISQANWIKIDVEGAELEVLKGGHNILSNSNDLALLVEVHGLNNYRPVLDLLTSYNFTVLLEKSYEGGEKHIIVRKSRHST
jgi:FkbM family methyltransferase